MGNLAPLLSVPNPVVQKEANVDHLLKNGLSWGDKKIDYDIITQMKVMILNHLKNSTFKIIFTDREQFLQELKTCGRINYVDSITGLTPLMSCAVLGRSDLGLKLIENGASIYAKAVLGLNALMMACLLGDEDFVDILLDSTTTNNHVDNVSKSCPLENNNQVDNVTSPELFNTNVNETNIMGVTALSYAVLSDSKEIVDKLVRCGANVNACTTDGTTAIHLAAMNGSEEILQILLNSKCNCNSKNLQGFTPLMWSVHFNHTDVTEALLKHGANVNETNITGYTALHISTANKHSESVSLLLNYSANCCQPDKQGRTPLMVAALQGDVNIVDKLIRHQQKESQEMINFTDNEGHTALFWASTQGHRHIVNLLLKAKANPYSSGYNGWTPLMAACMNGHEKIVKMLLQNEHPLNRRYLLALTFAVKKRHTNIVSLMLSRKDRLKHFLEMQETMPDEIRSCPILLTAAENGDSDILKALLRAGADINCRNSVGQTALLKAANAHYNIVNLLLQHDANTNCCDMNGNTPLIIASHAGCTDIVKLLLDKQADVNSTNSLGQSALMGAAYAGFNEVVQMLCDKNCSIGTKDINGWTALMLASQKGFGNIVYFLIKKEASIQNKTRHGVTAVMISAANGKTNTTKLLVEKGADIHEKDNNGYTPLLHAVSQNHGQAAEIFISKGADVNMCEFVLLQSPLIFSTFYGDQTTTEMLIEAGAQVNLVNANGWSCLHNAAQGGHHHLVKILCEHGADVNVVDRNKRTPLMLAANKGDATSVQYLIDKGAKYNICCSDGWSPLMLCCQHGYVECMQALFEKEDINIEYREKLGHSALSISAANGRQNAVHLMIQKGAKADTRNKNKQTPLMLSTYNGNKDVVLRLIQCKESLNLQDKEGNTALMIAAMTNRLDIAEALLGAGADVNATSNNKKTALHVSVQNNNVDMVKLLVRYKAKVDISDVDGNTPIMYNEKSGNHLIRKLLQDAAGVIRPNKEDGHLVSVDGDDLDDTTVARSCVYVGGPSDHSTEDSSIEKSLSKNLPGEPQESASKNENIITIRFDPEVKATIQDSHINKLEIHIDNKNIDVKEVQNLIIGDNGSIKCIGYMETLYSGCFGHVCCFGTAGHNGRYQPVKYTEETQSVSLSVDVTLQEHHEEGYLIPSNSYQSQSPNWPLLQRCVKTNNKWSIRKIRKRLSGILHCAWKWCKAGTVTITPFVASVSILPLSVHQTHVVV